MSADDLRAAMVDRIAVRLDALGLVLAPEVRRALLTVPRHLFTGDDADLQEAYADGAVITKRDERGVSTSSVSAPWLQAMMLVQAGVKPGMQALEIGSGGYNAALLRELAGEGGSVTSIDIDRDVTDRAQRCLTAAGYDDVDVLCADAEFPLTPPRRFDAIIVTAGAWDIPPSWPAQLAPGGRLVVPLRTKGLTRSWVLEQRDGALVSRGQQMCGFVPMQGAGAHRGTSISLLGDDVVGLWQDERDGIEAADLAGIITTPRAEAWTGVTIAAKAPYADQDLWLATRLPGFCLITARQHAIDDGTVALPWPYGTPAFVDGPNLAYRAKPRPAGTGGDLFEFGAIGHGPDAEHTAQTLAAQITVWDRAGRPAPRLSVQPASTPAGDLPEGYVLDKKHARLVISWPTAR